MFLIWRQMGNPTTPYFKVGYGLDGHLSLYDLKCTCKCFGTEWQSFNHTYQSWIQIKWTQLNKSGYNPTNLNTNGLMLIQPDKSGQNLIWRQQMNLAYFKIGYRWGGQFYLSIIWAWKRGDGQLSSPIQYFLVLFLTCQGPCAAFPASITKFHWVGASTRELDRLHFEKALKISCGLHKVTFWVLLLTPPSWNTAAESVLQKYGSYLHLWNICCRWCKVFWILGCHLIWNLYLWGLAT